MEITGIKRGQTIELDRELNLPDGCEVVLELRARPVLNLEERLQQLQRLVGAWSNQPDLEAKFASIAEERHQYQGRDLPSFE